MIILRKLHLLASSLRFGVVGCLIAVLLIFWTPARNVAAQTAQAIPDVGIDQRLDQQVPLDLPFRDETGRVVHLGDYFGSKPVILVLVYFSCPMLCSEVLSGVTNSLYNLKFNVGQEFNVVTVSFDARDTPQRATEEKEIYVGRYGRAGAAAGWHFLTGDEDSIKRLTEAVGFRYKFDPETNQFAHASGIMVLTPAGKLSRYFYGIEYPPRDLRLGLVEASDNKIGSLSDQVLLLCYHYDPSTGKYSAATMNFVRAGGALTLLVLGGVIFLMMRKEKAKRKAPNQEHQTIERAV